MMHILKKNNSVTKNLGGPRVNLEDDALAVLVFLDMLEDFTDSLSQRKSITDTELE